MTKSDFDNDDDVSSSSTHCTNWLHPNRLIGPGTNIPNTMIFRSWFVPMLMDGLRNALFHKTIEVAIQEYFNHHGRPPIVLDIGTGSGLLAIYAAKAGAQCVYACEALPVLADVAKQIVATAELDSCITIIPQRSTELWVGNHLPIQCDMVISEILDSALLGEGVRPSLRDARRRLLVHGAPSIPSSAVVYGQLVQTSTLHHMYHLPHGEGQAVQFPSCLGGQQAIPLHFAALRDASCLSDAAPWFHINFAAPHIGSSTEVVSCEMAATADGFLDGFLIFWELEVWPGLPHYTTDPSCSHWQDHWHQTLWPLSQYYTRIPVKKGDLIRVLAFHNDYDVWADVQRSPMADLPTAPAPCTCGWHPSTPPLRILALNSDRRAHLLLQSVLAAVERRMGGGCVLDICDGSIVGLLVAKHLPQQPVVVLAPKEEWRRRVRSLAMENGLCNVTVWEGSRAESWPQEHGLVSVLVGDAYFHDLENQLWACLNFWKLRTALASILHPDVLVMPHTGRLMGAVAHFRHLSDAHRIVHHVEDIDHRPFAEAQARATARDPDMPVGLWEYEHHLLMAPLNLLDLPFQKPLPATPPSIPGNSLHKRARAAVTHYGEAQALVLWVDLQCLGNCTTGDCLLQGYMGPDAGDASSKQMVRWLPQWTPASPAHHDVVISVSLDPVQPALSATVEVVPRHSPIPPPLTESPYDAPAVG
eukprot:GGOE01001232.1.p1 GENE.GGOE01001232.1~~GGOE01001232.1.p1  ORF type:complete len:713 (+),score=121.83 GGOE01001232.1:39-2141(+)